MTKSTPSKLPSWAKIVKTYPEANLLQSPAYAKMNEILGDKTITEDFGGQGYALMIVRAARRARYLEIPCGPLLNWQDKKAVNAVFAKIRDIAKSEKCSFVRLRPQLLATPENLQLLASLGLKKSPMHLAAEHTVMLDLTKSTDELLSDMRRQTRYEVRKAAKQGIVVEKSRDEAIFREFQAVQAKTAARQKFVPPSLKTLLAEREAFGKDIDIYVAKTGKVNEKTVEKPDSSVNQKSTEKPNKTASDITSGEPIAYGLIIRSGHEGDYYEAASTDLNRKLPGAYALLWQAMQDLKNDGYTRFNLWGIAPAGQPHHRYAGVTTFKTGFGGKTVTYVPAHDLVLSRAQYTLDWAFETARRKWRRLG